MEKLQGAFGILVQTLVQSAGCGMSRAALPHLWKRGETYWFRMALPADLVARFGRREFRLSLKTSDLRIARMRGSRLSVSFQDLIRMVRGMPELTRERINDLVRAHFEKRLSVANEIVWCSEHDDTFDKEMEIEGAAQDLKAFQRDAMASKFSSKTQKIVNELVDEAGFPTIPPANERYQYLGQMVARAEAEMRRVLIAKLSGNLKESFIIDPAFTGLRENVLPPIPGAPFDPNDQTAPSLLTVGEAVERFKANRQNGWVDKTRNDYERCLGWYLELVGERRPLISLTADDYREYRDMLGKLPSNASKFAEFAGKTGVQIAAAARGDQPGLATKTTNKYLGNVMSFLRWCVDESYLDKLPAPRSTMIGRSGPAKEERKPFSSEELKLIFRSPQYLGFHSKGRRHDTGSVMIKDGKYWIPLLGLFTGMRLGEIVQLAVTDIKQENGIPYIDVNDEAGGKRLKTHSSARHVPIHPALVQLGFLDFVQDLRKGKKGEGRLFPDIKCGSDGYYSNNFSQYFGRFLKHLGLTSPKLTFHSLRHNLADSLVHAGVGDMLVKAVLGHADHSVTARYGSRPPVATLYQAILKVDTAAIEHLLPKADQDAGAA